MTMPDLNTLIAEQGCSSERAGCVPIPCGQSSAARH